jgi:rubrerythrin
MRQLWKSVEDVLDYAIAEEQKAMATYRAFAGQSLSAEMKGLFAGFAADEARHAGRLLSMKKDKPQPLTAAQLALLPRARLPRSADGGELTVEAAYQFAIRAEKNAAELYTMLGQMSPDPAIQNAFESLAADEQGHGAKLVADLEKRRASAGFLTKPFRFVTKT